MSKIITLFVVSCLLLGCPTTTQTTIPLEAQKPEEYQKLQPRDFANYDSALSHLRNLPFATVTSEHGWTIVSVKNPNESSLWSFTPDSHSAHPAIVKREIIEANGSVHIRMTASCRASKPDCDALIAEFKLLNEKIKADLHNRP